MSACVGSDSLVGMSACAERPQGSVDLCERLRDHSFCVFGAGKSIEPSSQRCAHARETCCIARAFGTMMRMLLIWLLVFSTFVGVGCDYVGAPCHIALLAESGRLCHLALWAESGRLCHRVFRAGSYRLYHLLSRLSRPGAVHQETRGHRHIIWMSMP